MNITLIYLFLYYFLILRVKCETDTFSNINSTISNLDRMLIQLLPELNGKHKGEAGKICVIGGSQEYAAPYFTAISSLKSGADLASVITTEYAAPVIKSYSPELVVHPFLNYNSASKIRALLQKMDVIVIGPGLGHEDEALSLTYDIIQTCRTLQKPIVIDAGGLYAVSKNPSVLNKYPLPGAILTPNYREATELMMSTSNSSDWYSFWGDNVSVLLKGETDQFLSSSMMYNWSYSQYGSGRRVCCQGDILAGFLGTFFNWALKSNVCIDQFSSHELARSIAAFAAAKLTRLSNSNAYMQLGRNMIASDMLACIHTAFQETFS